ncbi:substrate binding domain-containing protein, partial [Myxococcota bacterium]|nr:substrate binding domain-containing protein [Myxococcota bacterium]
LTGTPRGRLRVSMPVAVGERLLAPHLPELRRRYPELRLELDLSDQNVELLKRGFDLAIRVGRPADSSLRAQLLGKIPVLLVASPRYLETHGEPKRPADLGAHACITVGPVGGPSEWTFHKQGRRESVVVDGVTHTTSPTLAAQLAVSGLGLLRTTEWIIRDELARGRLVPVMMAWSASPRSLGGVPVYAMYGTTTAPPLKTRVFVDLVRAIMADEVLRARRT